MKKERISLHELRQYLQKHGFAGIPLPENVSVAEQFATIASADSSTTFTSSIITDWVMVSYVQSNSALGTEGLPDWVAEDIEQVLDALLDAKLLSNRAVWFDRLGMRQTNDWTSIATLQCLAVPVICTPPTRTIEYSRYQIPDCWSPSVFEFYECIENILRMCNACSKKCPLEFDSRLLNVAAALRAWPLNEATIGAASKGAFISFATLDRLHYTIAWYQVLLNIALYLNGYTKELHAKSTELYGQALFQPCSKCIAIARDFTVEEDINVNCQMLDDALSTLLLQTNRFSLPWALDSEGTSLWNLIGLQPPPGEESLLGQNNCKRLLYVSRPHVSLRRFDEIAANIVCGRPALGSCHRNGDKWNCSLILSNLDLLQLSLDTIAETKKEDFRNYSLELLKLDTPFGELSYEHNALEMEPNRCFRSPNCTGEHGCICFFNELSGVLNPASVGEFLRDRGLSETETLKVTSSLQDALRSRLLANGKVFVCYELENGSAYNFEERQCAVCFNKTSIPGKARKQNILIAWRAKDETGKKVMGVCKEYSQFQQRQGQQQQQKPEQSDDTVYSFFAVAVNGSGHVWARGTYSNSHPIRCYCCTSTYVRVEIDSTEDMLEIHTQSFLPSTNALTMVFEAIRKSHKL